VPGAATENLKDDKEEDGLQIEGGVPDYAKAREKRINKSNTKYKGPKWAVQCLGLGPFCTEKKV
jgi:hypothetical protein